MSITPSWITKTRAAQSVPYTNVTVTITGEAGGGPYRIKNSITGDSEVISYAGGPKYDGYHDLVWKGCTHTKTKAISGTLCVPNCKAGGYWGHTWAGRIGADLSGRMPALPAVGEWPAQQLWDMMWDRINLNSSDAVLAYSGILQAVPLLGGLVKANRILNKIGRWATKSLRRKPFSEVIKAAIQADFIDRFVISPTLDDLRKVQQSTDYVLNILREVHERNMAPTALRVRLPNVLKTESGTGSTTVYYPLNYADGSITVNYDWKARAVRENALFLRAQLYYPANTLNPVKIWAQRVGLTRPLDSVWDLVPFSFVADYFFRSGDFISHLSDQMSQVEGLCGKVANVLGAWATQKASSVVEAEGKSAEWNRSYWHQYYNPTIQKSFTFGKMVYKSSVFSRTPLPNEVLCESGFFDGKGFFSPHLTVTRMRTMAELFIQAKL